MFQELAYRKGASKKMKYNTLLFNRVCKTLEVLDELKGVDTQSLFYTRSLSIALLIITLIDNAPFFAMSSVSWYAVYSQRNNLFLFLNRS